jgi:hypothetical protein
MQYIERFVFTDSPLTGKTSVVRNALKHIAQRVLAILALMLGTYGLLAAEVELAKIEGFPAPVIR